MCSKLAMLLGEGTSSQTDTTSPVRMPTAAAPKKMTPKRKLHIGWIILLVMRYKLMLYFIWLGSRLELNYGLLRWTCLCYNHGFMRWAYLFASCLIFYWSISWFYWPLRLASRYSFLEICSNLQTECKYDNLYYLETKANIWSIIITENADSQMNTTKGLCWL